MSHESPWKPQLLGSCPHQLPKIYQTLHTKTRAKPSLESEPCLDAPGRLFIVEAKAVSWSRFGHVLDIRFGTCSMAPGCSRALRQTWTQNYARNIKKPTEAETCSKQKAVCPSSFCIVPHWKEQLWCLALLSSSLCLSLTICCHETKLRRNAWQCLNDFKSGFFGPFMRFDVRHGSKMVQI